MSATFVKLDAKGKPLSLRSNTWVAVLDESTNLIWSRDHVTGGRMNWQAAIKAAAAFDLCGQPGRAPTRAELLSLVDDTRYSPAIDTRFFPECQSVWEWASTPYAPSPGDYAWLVLFSNGHSGWGYQYHEGFVRAVRPGQFSAIGPRGKKSKRAV